jgi:hypothetical protein
MDKWEFFEVCRLLKPALTLDEYERMWDDFIRERELWRRRN